MNSLNAIRLMMPRIDYGSIVRLEELAGLTSRSTGLSQPELMFSYGETTLNVQYFLRTGRKVEIPGIGLFVPKRLRSGLYRASCIVDRELWAPMNLPGGFLGNLLNLENADLTDEELIIKWNELYPENPVLP